MKWVIRIFLAVLAIAIAGLGYAGWRVALGTPFNFSQLANRQTILFALDHPELLTSLGVVDGGMFDFHSGKLEQVTVDARDREYVRSAANLAEIARWPVATLSADDLLTRDVLTSLNQQALDAKAFDWLSIAGVYPINPMFGEHTALPRFLDSQHVVKNAKTARTWVERLEQVDDKLDQIRFELQRQAKLGVILPKSLIPKTTKAMRDFILPKEDENPIYKNFVAKLPGVKGLSPEKAAKLQARALAAMQEQVYPAYARLIQQMDELATLASDDAGVWKLPDGDKFYAMALREQTTTDWTPDQVHQIGLDEVARISAQMDDILKANGLTQGRVGARMQQLSSDPRFVKPNTDEGRAQLLALYRQIIADAQARMPEVFANLPADEVLVARVPTYAELGTGGAYYEPGAMDGSRAGTFFANLRDTAETPVWSMKTLAYHEAVPGHHLQIAFARKLEVPLVRQQPLFTAYAEGWALYAERLMAEMGFYKDDPFGDLGRLQAELFRAARLVVDTGIHAKKWTRAEAINYMVTVVGMSETDITSEVERYMVLPGQACAYKVGQMKILALREKARSALGDQFNLKDFHAVVLDGGALPLTSLERKVDAWIAQAKAIAPAKAGPA